MMRSPSVRLKAGPGGSGVAQIALRDVAYWECPPGLLGAPWLLIEMCAWSLVTDASAGCSTGSARTDWPLRRLETWMATRTTAWAGIDIGKTHHGICAVDADGRPLLSVKVANVEGRPSGRAGEGQRA